jgi:hypothetical protein
MFSPSNTNHHPRGSRIFLVGLFALACLIGSEPAFAEKICLRSLIKKGKVVNSVFSVASASSCPKKSLQLFNSTALTEFGVGLNGVEIVGSSHSITLAGGGGSTSFSMNCPTGKAIIGHLCREGVGDFLVDPDPSKTFLNSNGDSFSCQFYNGIGSQATHTVDAFAICASVG